MSRHQFKSVRDMGIWWRTTLIGSIGEALNGQRVALLCPPGREDRTRAEIDQILGPIPFPKTLQIMTATEVDDDSSPN